MALTKSRTSIWSGQTLTAGAADTNSSWLDLSDAYGAIVDVKLTNGATGPTVAAQVQVQVAAAYNAGSPVLPVSYGPPLVGVTTNSGVTSWSIEAPIGVAALRLVAGSNTGQNVTVDADIDEVTAL